MLNGQKLQLFIVSPNLVSTFIKSIDFHAWLNESLNHYNYLQRQTYNNIAKTQQLQKDCHDKKVMYVRQFVMCNVVIYHKEKICKKHRQFQAKFI